MSKTYMRKGRGERKNLKEKGREKGAACKLV